MHTYTDTHRLAQTNPGWPGGHNADAITFPEVSRLMNVFLLPGAA